MNALLINMFKNDQIFKITVLAISYFEDVLH